MRVGIYARISTTDKGQDLQTQLIPLQKYADAREWDIYQIYTDTMSGAKSNRPGFIQMMKDATKRKFDVVLVFRFDRASRSTKELIQTLETLRVLGISFVSYSESIDTSTPMWQMMFTIISALAQFERSLIQERVKAWLERARHQGKKLWRPKKDVDIDKILILRKTWLSHRQIANKTGYSSSMVQRAIASKTSKNSEE